MDSLTPSDSQAQRAYENLKLMMEGFLVSLQKNGADNIELHLERLKNLQAQLELDLSVELSERRQLTSTESQIYRDMIAELLNINMQLANLARTYMVTIRSELDVLKKSSHTISAYKSGIDAGKSMFSIST